MKKSDQVELHQLKVGLEAMMVHLNDGLDHLDDLTCATIGRALGELLQETANLPPPLGLAPALASPHRPG